MQVTSIMRSWNYAAIISWSTERKVNGRVSNLLVRCKVVLEELIALAEVCNSQVKENCVEVFSIEEQSLQVQRFVVSFSD